MRMFTSKEVPDSTRQLVDKLINCEDILFNVMVAFYLKKMGKPQCPALYTRPRDLKDIQKTSSKLHSFVNRCMPARNRTYHGLSIAIQTLSSDVFSQSVQFSCDYSFYPAICLLNE